MRRLNIGHTANTAALFATARPKVDLALSDLTDVAAAVVSHKDGEIMRRIIDSRMGIPIFAFVADESDIG
ncbi:MAG: hypothetical protein LBP30_05495, partial [Clostridiales Family XIII bacterium]|nr:hypothetical protein [Clostridiales Family XIII bacterium]